MTASDAPEARGGHGRLRDPHLWSAVSGVALLAFFAWPAWRPAVPFPDTTSFVNWPAPMIAHGVELMGARAAGYPLVLRLFGVGPELLLFQWLLSLLCWSYLGWKLARGPGAVLGGLFSLAPALVCWTHALLAESVSLSLAALLLGIALDLGRGFGAGRASVFVLVCLTFVLVRDANLLVLPFLGLPLLARRTRRSAIVVGSLALIVAGGAWDIARNERGSLYTYLSIFWRVGPDAEAKAWFVARGLPRGRMDASSTENLRAHYDWLNDGGTWIYRRWALMQPAFYLDTWRLLAQPDGSLALPGEFFSKVETSRNALLAAAADRLYRWSAPPRPVWLLLLLLPAVDAWRNRRIGVPSFLAAALVVGTYVQGFVSYVSDFSQIQRHMLGAYLLYRLATFVGLFALVDVFVAGPRAGVLVAWAAAKREVSALPASGAAASVRPSRDTG